MINKVLAWGVHVFTASGIVAGFMSILAINKGAWDEAMWWLLACQVIDGVDGTFARMAKVKEVLPFMNGTTMDNVIDFVTYAVIPVYFFYQASLVEESLALPLAFLMLIVSVLYYGKEGMISDDLHFVGFPVLWNLVVFYEFFVFSFPGWINAAIIVVLSILHFVPLKFAYPSRMTRYRLLTIVVTVVLFCCIVAILFVYPERHFFLSLIAVLGLVYYVFLAIWVSYFKKS